MMKESRPVRVRARWYEEQVEQWAARWAQLEAEDAAAANKSAKNAAKERAPKVASFMDDHLAALRKDGGDAFFADDLSEL